MMLNSFGSSEENHYGGQRSSFQCFDTRKQATKQRIIDFENYGRGITVTRERTFLLASDNRGWLLHHALRSSVVEKNVSSISR